MHFICCVQLSKETIPATVFIFQVKEDNQEIASMERQYVFIHTQHQHKAKHWPDDPPHLLFMFMFCPIQLNSVLFI